MPKYNVSVTISKVVELETEVEVDAENVEAAIKRACELVENTEDLDDFDWRQLDETYDTNDIDTISAERIDETAS